MITSKDVEGICRAAFALESVAHLKKLEVELLPHVEHLRDIVRRFEYTPQPTAPAPVITVRTVSSYCQRRVYPVCDTAKQLARLIKTETFTDHHIEAIKALGYVIVAEVTP